MRERSHYESDVAPSASVPVRVDAHGGYLLLADYSSQARKRPMSRPCWASALARIRRFLLPSEASSLSEKVATGMMMDGVDMKRKEQSERNGSRSSPH